MISPAASSSSSLVSSKGHNKEEEDSKDKYSDGKLGQCAPVLVWPTAFSSVLCPQCSLRKTAASPLATIAAHSALSTVIVLQMCFHRFCHRRHCYDYCSSLAVRLLGLPSFTPSVYLSFSLLVSSSSIPANCRSDGDRFVSAQNWRKTCQSSDCSS